MGDFHVIDVHNHHGELVAGVDGSSDGHEEALDTHITCLDQRGVDRAVVIAGHGYLRPNGLADTRVVNDAVARYCDQGRGRIAAAVGIVEPLYGEVGLDELDRCRFELGLCGISFHTRFQGVAMEHPWLRRYVAHMAEIGLVPFLHAVAETSEESLWKVDVLASESPIVPMIVLDAFSSFEQINLAPHIARRHPHLLFDTALSVQGFDPAYAMVKEFGAERVLYGSDLYTTLSRRQLPDVLGQILASDLPDDQKAAVLGGNAARVLSIDAATEGR